MKKVTGICHLASLATVSQCVNLLNGSQSLVERKVVLNQHNHSHVESYAVTWPTTKSQKEHYCQTDIYNTVTVHH